MLSAGFQTLADLKARLLPDAGNAETEWDTKLASVGLGVSEGFDRYCGRNFGRGVDVTESYEAQASAWTLARYPVESLSSLAIIDADGGSSAIATTEALLNKRSGILELYGHGGGRHQRIEITYTGGYWLDDGSAQPAGAAALPRDLIEAYYLQCQHLVEAGGLFADVAMRSEAERSALAAAALTPYVSQVLDRYRRFGMP